MACSRSVILSARTGDRAVVIDALVNKDLKDNVLVSWHDLIKLGVLSEDFLQPSWNEAPVLSTVVKDEIKDPGKGVNLDKALLGIKEEFVDILGTWQD